MVIESAAVHVEMAMACCDHFHAHSSLLSSPLPTGQLRPTSTWKLHSRSTVALPENEQASVRIVLSDEKKIMTKINQMFNIEQFILHSPRFGLY